MLWRYNRRNYMDADFEEFENKTVSYVKVFKQLSVANN